MRGTATTPPARVPYGIPYKTDTSARNTERVRKAVAERFPEWAPQCEPYVNVLTLRAWNQRGFRVKKGEKAIRVPTLVPLERTDEKTGEVVQAGTRHGTAYVFAFPQVEKRR